MGPVERGFEWTIERSGLAIERLMVADPWWRRSLGTVLGALAICTMLPLLAWWWLFGKRPK